MALFENYEGRMPQLQPVLDKYGFKSTLSGLMSSARRSP